MTYKIVIQTEAVNDIKEAYEWYENQSLGLGYELIEELENCFKKLTNHPQYYNYINYIYRRIKTNRFPYLLVYEIEKDKIIINSIRHGSRKPRYGEE